MNTGQKTSSTIKEVRVLVGRYSQSRLEQCLDLAVNNQTNPCFCALNNDEAVSTLAKASFVSKLMVQGKSRAEAMRELAKRIRFWV